MNHHFVLKAIIFISVFLYPCVYVQIGIPQVVQTDLKSDNGKTHSLTNILSGSNTSGSITSRSDTSLTQPKTSTTSFHGTASTTSQFKVKGIHVTSWVAGSDILFQKMINLLRETELNTVVIDLKEVDGIIGYEVDVPMAKEIKATQRRIRDIDKVISLCNEYGIYKIARITVFKDNQLATKKPHLAVLDKLGNLWHDDDRRAWVNPYSKEVWEYNLTIAKDAVRHGFDEIQFDYVRFPSDGKIKNCCYGSEHSEEKAKKTISEFVKFAKQTLGTTAFLSIDVFGLTTCRDDVGIGQKFKEIAKNIDYISPMIYPSHYARGSYGMTNPDSQAYKTVFLSLRDANRQIKETNCKIRPWLQDFSLGSSYGASEVRAQIKAVYAQGLDEWLLWNPRCNYTKNALLADDKIKFVQHTLPRQIPAAQINAFQILSKTLPLFYMYDPIMTIFESIITLKELKIMN
ncbi:MAG: putative glycoside hydrolase [Nitrospirota bacterium]